MNTEHTEKKYGIREEAKEFPMMVVVGLSYICNSRCVSCPYTHSDIRTRFSDNPFMSERIFKAIADECGRYSSYIRISGGGEPLLHPQAVELIVYAKNVGAKVGLITNASCLSAEKTHRLLEANVDMVECSVDADNAALYRKLRPGLDWDEVVGNIKRTVSMRNDMKSRSKIVVSAINQEGVDVDAVMRMWKPKVDDVQIRKFLTWDIVENKSADSTPYLPPEDKIPCPHIFERLLVDARGKVMLCAFDIGGSVDVGNVHEKSIRDIWLGDAFDYYRTMHLEKRGDQIDMCRRCPDWKYRSWKHNYWKIIRKAEGERKQQVENSDVEGMEIL